MGLKKPSAEYKGLQRRDDISLWDLASGFSKMGICSFGGGLTAWAEQIAVKERKWLNDDDFLHALAICQILPGPNMIKLCVYIGAGFRGWRGALAALTGLLLIPIIIVMGFGIFFIKAGSDTHIHAVLAGLGACAAGMAFSLGLKFGVKNMKDWIFVFYGVISFIAIGLLRWPMLWVIAVLSPMAILSYWYYGKRKKAKTTTDKNNAGKDAEKC